MSLPAALLGDALLSGGVLAMASLGELLAERVGVLNLGVEGLMALGGIAGIAAADATHDAFSGFAAAIAVGMLAGAVFAFATVLMRANQVLCGMALTLGGSGLAATLGRSYAGRPVQAVFERVHVPLLDRLPVLGQALFSQNPLVLLTWLVLPVALHALLFGTRHGLALRAIGENPQAADASGLRVLPLRFAYVVLGAGLSAAAGAYLTLGFVPSWSDGIVGGRGWIAVALVIFAGYRPLRIAGGALLFGLVNAFGYLAQARDWGVPSAFLAMAPYLATMLFMILPALLARGRLALPAPAALGLAYFRDQR